MSLISVPSVMHSELASRFVNSQRVGFHLVETLLSAFQLPTLLRPGYALSDLIFASYARPLEFGTSINADGF